MKASVAYGLDRKQQSIVKFTSGISFWINKALGL